MIACGIKRPLLVAERHRSNTRRYCLGVQGLVGWEHPRRARLGLIEALTGAKQWSLYQSHPRRARLGLIEAAYEWRTIPYSHSTHPRRARLGLIEAHAGFRKGRLTRLHPRRARLGLIEAYYY